MGCDDSKGFRSYAHTTVRFGDLDSLKAYITALDGLLESYFKDHKGEMVPPAPKLTEHELLHIVTDNGSNGDWQRRWMFSSRLTSNYLGQFIVQWFSKFNAKRMKLIRITYNECLRYSSGMYMPAYGIEFLNLEAFRNAEGEARDRVGSFAKVSGHRKLNVVLLNHVESALIQKNPPVTDLVVVTMSYKRGDNEVVDAKTESIVKPMKDFMPKCYWVKFDSGVTGIGTV